ncbi:MAG: FHA domain-containing protein [Bernardetiaceae bacterium]|nr:FHA domain-containing protein [Bernardetiaceae bacterium]
MTKTNKKTDKKLYIGKAATNDIVLQNRYVSDVHAVLHLRQDKVFITDTGSTFGTYVNGKRIENSLQIYTTDKIKIGNLLLDWESFINADTPNPDDEVYFSDLFSLKGSLSLKNYIFSLFIIVSTFLLIIAAVPLFLYYAAHNLLSDDDLMYYCKPIWILLCVLLFLLLVLRTIKMLKSSSRK